MATKIFLDTNIVLDLLDNQRQCHSEAVLLFDLIDNGEVLAYISESVVTTTDYILQKLLSKSFRVEFFKEISKKIQILSCNNLILDRAIILELEDLEDAILYQMAIENKIDYFISNDKKLLASGLKVLTIVQAADYLEIIKKPK
ncbi:PIN domain-containing protein [Lacihabitans sp. LS3-19]|uniref:type II toxin-antitoxin system VapC family toxin n=1 Tax=Lacihabitans sp. LS3-19 TaxID=2487335 RepID=UPI0020CD35F4|nr:PIN domain-containing protein [Lacihabitans sp. LS3-19]MCP9770631.1 PIN domain-containing protein [Lacihabitans sp. LS3-19]